MTGKISVSDNLDATMDLKKALGSRGPLNLALRHLCQKV